jgi:hypothetical protein
VLALGTALALARLIEQRKAIVKQGLRFGFDAVFGKTPLAAFERRNIT